MTARFDDLVITRWRARYRGQEFPCAVGRGGIGEKRGEGDNITPLGIYDIAGAGYRADRMLRPFFAVPAVPIGPADIWSDDPADPNYNQGLTARRYPFSHERLPRPDPMYDVFAILTYNWPDPVPGAGSAIFLHNWRKPRHPTAGCVAFAPAVLFHILSTWSPRARVVIRP